MKKQILKLIRKQPRWRLAVGALVLVLLVVGLFSSRKSAQTEITFTAKRGDLNITVLEGGSVEALEFQEVRSEVRGAAGIKILKIVEEGSIITEEDVKKGRVLVELDSADLRDRLVQQEINYQTALSSLTDASQGYEIQRNLNTSSIKAAEQKALFARMDVEKFLGDKSADEVVKRLKLDKVEAAAYDLISGVDAETQMLAAMEQADAMEKNEISTNLATSGSARSTNSSAHSKPQLTLAGMQFQAEEDSPSINFAEYAKPESLGDGSAMQELRKNTNALQSARQEFSLAETKLSGTKRLFEKGFATKTELDTDTINYENCELMVKTAETAYNLYIKYEFPKLARDLTSKFDESLRALEREKKMSISKLAQARARLKGAEGRYNIESNQRKDLMDQLSKCVIKAERPGLVVYGGASSDRFDGSEQIREGATVRERQPIITIPNMARMSVRVKIHETYIQKISKGLKATVHLDAFPNATLSGEVIKVALLPDSQNRWMNPDMKIYQTSVGINATNGWIKPGMSAKVELMVKELKDVICVPLQAVTENDGKRYCQVVNGKIEKREVQTGEFNDEFIEIKDGLRAGERVSLRIPDAEVNPSDKEESSENPKPPGKPAVKPAAPQLAAKGSS